MEAVSESRADQDKMDAALAQWTGRTRMRKGKGRTCACWLLGERCSGARRTSGGGRAGCKPPRADHCTTWGFGRALRAFRVLCSQPYGEDSLEQAREMDAWARVWGLTVMEWPARSWHYPGWTTLHVVVPDHMAREMAREPHCPGCGAAGAGWSEDRACCWTAEIIGGWEQRDLAGALMGERG